ncbi:MAG: hypothetical protein Sapg2KO_22520 [Saprospiraceae bacterium]
MIVKSLFSNTALLIFTRSASLEARQKPLAFRRKHAEKVAQLLNEKALELAKSTGLTYFIVNEKLQEGGDFASRFDSAFQYVFDKGFDKIVSIGNDCLGLTRAQILAAALDLKQQDFVIGPTQRGGLYLFGLNIDAYQKLDFQDLPWQTNQLFTCLEQKLKSSSFAVKTYALSWEVNYVYEWSAVLRQIRHFDYLKVKINSLLEQLPILFFTYLWPCSFIFLSENHLRGPPRI